MIISRVLTARVVGEEELASKWVPDKTMMTDHVQSPTEIKETFQSLELIMTHILIPPILFRPY